MKVARTLPELHAACLSLRRSGRKLALVPTMGALHDGHGSLVRAAAQAGMAVTASIFVNPLQFGPNEDFARYPRDEGGDLHGLRQWGCDLAWLPAVPTMYPASDATTIDVKGPALLWEGAHRPGHFGGVATVVAKLLGQVQPDCAYFGEKDWQQLQVIRRMAADLLLPVSIAGVPTVRESDGLALSSRNRFLTPDQRAAAPLLYRLLRQLADQFTAGHAAGELLGTAHSRLTAEGFNVDYLALVNATTLAPIAAAETPWRLIAAARLGTVRLLDNVGPSA